MMRCPRCQQENPDTVRFCIHCGLPLTEETREAYARTNAAAEKRRKYRSGFGQALSGIGKAICYVLLFIFIQSAVIGFYSV